MKGSRGFVWLIPLLIVAVAIVLGGGAYWYSVASQSQQVNGLTVATTTTMVTATPATNSANTTTAAPQSNTPAINVLSVVAAGPARISFSYQYLPSRTSAIAVCEASGGCTEWVEPFIPSATIGTSVIATSDGDPTSFKGLGDGSYKLVVIGSSFSDQLLSSPIFTLTKGLLNVPSAKEYHAINEVFAVDAQHAYVYGQIGIGVPQILAGADVKTFVSTGNFSAKDANHTYGLDAKGYLEIDGNTTFTAPAAQ